MRAHFSVGRCSILPGVLENLGVAAGIASLSCLQPEVYVGYFRFRRRYVKFGMARADFGVGRCSTLLGVLENIGVAAGMASLSCSQPVL